MPFYDSFTCNGSHVTLQSAIVDLVNSYTQKVFSVTCTDTKEDTGFAYLKLSGREFYRKGLVTFS